METEELYIILEEIANIFILEKRLRVQLKDINGKLKTMSSSKLLLGQDKILKEFGKIISLYESFYQTK